MNKWGGHLKNSQDNITTDKMLDLCEEMVEEQDKRFENISKSIKREQKLKSQNHFILKENIYLK